MSGSPPAGSSEVARRRPASDTRPGNGQRVDDLLRRMTLEEKVGQMTQLTVGAVAAHDSPGSGTLTLDPDRLRHALVERHVGSLINILGGSLTIDGWRRALRQVQDVALRETRLGIPVVYGIDHVHGANYVIGGTIFPHNLALAAAFDRDLVRGVGARTGAETRAAGLPWNFAPVLDVGRQPLWPRFYETFGEAAWAVAELGEAYIRGLREGSGGRVAATAKHYLAYSGPANGRDRTPALLGRRTVREQFLPPFRRAVDAGIRAVMVNSGEIDGEPVHASRYWLTDVLRGELGFDGVLVTDWADVTFLHTRHRVAPTLRDATRMVVEAGIDLAMTPDNYDFPDHLLALVQDGVVPEERVDASVRRILAFKEELGLFDSPIADDDAAGRSPPPALPAGSAAGSAPGRTAGDTGPASAGFGAPDEALEACRAAITLLRNDGTLPLPTGARVLVTGPAATSLTALSGGWTHTWQGTDATHVGPGATTLLEEIRRRAGGVEHVEGATFPGAADAEAVEPAAMEAAVEAAVEAAKRADVAIVALGEDAYSEWAGDIRDLTLPAAQLRLAEAVIGTGTPTVLVLVQGRPRIIRPVAERAAGIVMAYWPGERGARAVAEVLFGEVAPSGRLPFTWPRWPNDLTPHDHKRTESFDTRLEPRGPGGFDPQFELGHGLGYATFEYDELRVSPDEAAPGDAMAVTVRVQNTGDRRSAHSVLLFTRQHYAALTPHERRLRGFEKVELAPGESRTVSFPLHTDALRYEGREGALVLEPGEYDIMVGELSTTIRVKEGP